MALQSTPKHVVHSATYPSLNDTSAESTHLCDAMQFIATCIKYVFNYL